jgi:hypothetical protein
MGFILRVFRKLPNFYLNRIPYWLMLALRKIFKPKLWSKLWSQFLKVNQKMELTRLKVSYAWL